MADQLAPLGIEFDRNEMERIFSCPDGTTREEWGMGTIRNPRGVTTYLDRAYDMMVMSYQKLAARGSKVRKHLYRTPGRYHKDDGDGLLPNVNEVIHPSVRIRYLYGGSGLDDRGVWGCEALVGGPAGYELRSGLAEPITRPGRRDMQSKMEYQSVVGVVIPYYGPVPALKDRPKGRDRKLVRIEQPIWFRPAFNSSIDELLPRPERRWYWMPNGHEGPVLEEEHLGIWEQKFVYMNDLLRKEQCVADAKGKGKSAKTVGGQTHQYKLDRSRAGEALPKDFPDGYRLFDVNRWSNWY